MAFHIARTAARPAVLSADQSRRQRMLLLHTTKRFAVADDQQPTNS